MSNKDKVWHEIGNKLTSYLGICPCQRKLKSIISVLVRIWDKRNYLKEGTKPFTDYEFLILAVLDSKNLITHGSNCEYPIFIDNEFWEFILKVKDLEELEDN